MGLDRMHAFTASKNFGLKAVVGDQVGSVLTTYHAIYDTFGVRFDLRGRLLSLFPS